MNKETKKILGYVIVFSPLSLLFVVLYVSLGIEYGWATPAVTFASAIALFLTSYLGRNLIVENKS